MNRTVPQRVAWITGESAGIRTRAHYWRPAEALACMIEPEEVARAVRFAIDSPRNSFVFDVELNRSPV